jgi:thioredoxin 1
MAAELALTTSQFEEEVMKSEVPVLVDFWATWCGPCRMIAPFVDQLASEFAGKAKVFKVDVDSEGELAMRFGVQSIPQLLIFKGGQEVDRHVGAAPKNAIEALINKHV